MRKRKSPKMKKTVYAGTTYPSRRQALRAKRMAGDKGPSIRTRKSR